jgi:hypothetical protein
MARRAGAAILRRAMSEAIADRAGPTGSERRPDGQFIRWTIADARYS